MKSLRIFLLHFQRVFEFRSRNFVWFLITFFNPLILLLFWRGAISQIGQIDPVWSLSTLSSYYLLSIVARSVTIAHVEEDIATKDIKEGGLVKYLMKPYSYYAIKFYEELPWRIIQSVFGILSLFVLVPFFTDTSLQIANTAISVTAGLVVLAFGLLLNFTYKMILGMLAFWFIDIWGLFQASEVIMLAFGGYIMPIDLMPSWVKTLALATPFPAMTYYPILALQGKISLIQFGQVLVEQSLWFIALVLVYKILWNFGIKKFTAVGQ